MLAFNNCERDALSRGGVVPAPKGVALGFRNLTVLFALNDQISTKFKLNKNQIYWSTANTIKYHVLNRGGMYLVGLTP